jgi:hypothetical protein
MGILCFTASTQRPNPVSVRAAPNAGDAPGSGCVPAGNPLRHNSIGERGLKLVEHLAFVLEMALGTISPPALAFRRLVSRHQLLAQGIDGACQGQAGAAAAVRRTSTPLSGAPT